MTQTLRSDLIVVGGGGAGLTAAATAAAMAPGLSINLLEADGEAACNTSIASNFIPAAGTRFQRAAGIEDSPEALTADILKKNGGHGDPELTQWICEASADTLHWMVDALGVELELAPELTWLGHSAVRMHAHPSRGGPAVLAALKCRLSELDQVRVFDPARATGLIISACGVVTGVNAVVAGEAIRFEAPAVVLACGGFGANPEQVARHIPEMADAPHIGAATEQGDAIAWSEALGARLARMSAYQGRDCISADGTRVTPPVLSQGGIAIDRTGRRFVNELNDYSALARVYRQQPGGYAFFVWDQRIQDMVSNVFVMQQAMARGGIVRAASLDELARSFNLPPHSLAETLAERNAPAPGTPDAFGRPTPEHPLKPAYYAARITGAIAHTQGGLVIDDCGRVISNEGSFIPGLYAVGNAIAGLSGDSCTGYLSGNGLLVAYTTGYVVGRHLAGPPAR